ncbi:hypothetical protein [Streptomyces sp. NPDC051079]|uniref:hypothetical protein n=1 Tax=Streptomyces sp. NPDC051079 TaxID=3155043 RepID=UPI00344B0219
MPVEHAADGGILALSVPSDLDVTNRAAAALQLETLVLAYRPLGVHLHLPHGPATRPTLSVLARVRRLCEALGIPLVLTDRPWPPPASVRAAGPLALGLPDGGTSS